MSANRILPIRLDPLPGESIESWLQALAFRNRTYWADLLKSLGLVDPKGRLENVATMDLHRNELAQLAESTGVALGDIPPMTACGGHGERDEEQLPWVWQRGTRFCPQCLTERAGRYLLEWKLGWIFACERHSCLLADRCPVCGVRPLQRTVSGEVVPRPGICLHNISRRPRWPIFCGTDLADAEVVRLPADHPGFAAQAVVRTVIAEGVGEFGVYALRPQPAAVVLADIRAIGRRTMSYATADDLVAVAPVDLVELYRLRRDAEPNGDASYHVRDRGSARAPSDSAVMAMAVTAAVEVLSQPDIHSAGRRLEYLVQPTRKRGLEVSATSVKTWGAGTSSTLGSIQLSALKPLLTVTDQLRYRTATSAPRHPDRSPGGNARIAQALPSLMWPNWSLRLTPAGVAHAVLQPILSCAVLITGSQMSPERASKLLGTNVSNKGFSFMFRRLRADAHWDDILQAIDILSDCLETNPAAIDYDRRRRLDYSGVLSARAWTGICRTTDAVYARPRLADVARTVLFSRLSAMPPQLAPYAPWRLGHRDRVQNFAYMQTPELAQKLDTVARKFLSRHRIDEPVTWTPPADLIAHLDLPFQDPMSIDIDRLHNLVTLDRYPIGELARQMGCVTDAIRFALQAHPPPPRSSTRGQRANRAALKSLDLTPAMFRELRDVRGYTYAQMASTIGVSTDTVSRMARTYGIEPSSVGRKSRVVVDPEWLRQHYLVNRETTTSIAKAIGTSSTTVRRLLGDYGVPIRHRGASTLSWTDPHAVAEAPAVLRSALSSLGGRQRLERFVAAMAYSSLSEAATHLGVRQAGLTQQFTRLEQDLDHRLYIRARRGHPMTPTGEGNEVLRAMALLHRNDVPEMEANQDRAERFSASSSRSWADAVSVDRKP